MSWIIGIGMRFLPFLKNWKVAAGAIVVASILANGWYINHLQNQRDQLTLDKAMVTQWYSECQDINVENQRTVAIVRGANESLAAAITISHDEVLKAAEMAAERELQSKLALDDTLDEMRDLQNANPSCKKLSQIDIGAVCPLTVQRLREHALGTNGSIRND